MQQERGGILVGDIAFLYCPKCYKSASNQSMSLTEGVPVNSNVSLCNRLTQPVTLGVNYLLGKPPGNTVRIFGTYIPVYNLPVYL